MKLWHRVRRRLGLRGRDRGEAAMDEELRIHVSMEAEHLMRTEGLDPAEARRRALVAFGGVERMKERARDVRGSRWAEDLVQDCRIGTRALRRSPGFTAAAVLTLTLGVGATTAMFSVVSGVLLAPLPYPASERLVAVWSRFLPESGFDFPEFPLSPPEYFDYRSQTHALGDVAAHSGVRATIMNDHGLALSVRGAAATANLFEVLRVGPVLGRTYTVQEDVPTGADVVVLGHALWQRAYGGDEAVLGRTIRVNGRPLEVIGVMPVGFSYPTPETELWLPARLDPVVDAARGSHYLQAVGRLADGADFELAERERAQLMQRWQAEYPDVHTGHFLFLRPLLENVVGTARPALLALLGAVGFVLLIVCANVANLLLARAEARRPELAVRSALGAGRARLVRQFIAEGAVLSAIGAAAGVGVAYVLLRATLALGADSVPRAHSVSLDGGVLLFTAAVAAVSTIVFALAPLITLNSGGGRSALRDDHRTTSSSRGLRLRRALVAAQVALAVIVVTGAGLMVRSFVALAGVEPGFRAERVMLAELSLPAGAYPDDVAVIGFYQELLERLGRLAGVENAAAISTLPLGGWASNIDFRIEGAAPPAPGEPAHSGDLIITDPGFVQSFDVAVLEGRFFERTDRTESLPVVVVNRRLARQFWPGESAVGKRLRIAESDDRPWLEVVGIIDDVQYRGPADEIRPAWYLPLAQMTLSLGQPARTFHVAVRTSPQPATLATAIRATIRAVDPDIAVVRLRPLETVVSGALARPRFTTGVLGLFAALALLLGAIGIYGVLAYAVTRRTREFGIRMALGAGWRELAALVLREGFLMVVLGLGFGLAAAAAATRLIHGLLFRVDPADPATLLAVAALVCLAALLASVGPLWRAYRTDPVRALRTD
jgi:predicted permease